VGSTKSETAPVRIRLKFPDRTRFARVYEREISKGGIFLKAPKTQPVGTQVVIQFLPGGSAAGLELSGQVVHAVEPDEAQRTGQSPGIGIRFTDLGPPQQQAIHDYLSGVTDDFVIPEPEPEPEPPSVGPGPLADRSPGYEPELDAMPAAEPAVEAFAIPGPDDQLTTPDLTEPAPSAEPEPVEPEGEDSDALERFTAELDAVAARMEGEADYYTLLEVDPDASPEEINEAFIDLKRRCHPDRFQAKGTAEIMERATRLFEEVNKAFQTLAVPSRRAAYNITLGRYTARYMTEEEEEAHRAVSNEFRRKYCERYPAKIRKAEMFALAAEGQAEAGKIVGARNSLRLALSFDPLNSEYRERLQKLDAGEVG